jgi:hypothetical protein
MPKDIKKNVENVDFHKKENLKIFVHYQCNIDIKPLLASQLSS